MGPLLLVAVVAPALAGVAAWRLPPPLARAAVQWASAAAAAVWVVASAFGDVTVGPLGVARLAGPAAAGVALAGAAVHHPLRRLPTALVGLAVTAATGGLAVSGGEGAPVDVASGLVGAALVVAVATRFEADGGLLHAAVALVGAALVGFGIATLDGGALPTRGTLDGGTTWPVVAGAVLVVVASTGRPRRALAVLLPLALALAVPVLPLAAAGRGPIAGVLAAGAAAASLRSRHAPAAAIALLALAAAALPGTLDAAVLLAAAAVVAHVAAVPAAAAAALPGASLLALAVADHTDRAHLVVAALAVVVAAGITRHATRDDLGIGHEGARPGAWAALLLGGWLLVAPHTWSWTGGSAPRGWGAGAIVAATGAAVALAVLTDLGNRSIPLGRLDAPDGLLGRPEVRRSLVAVCAAAVVAAGAAGALLRSVAA
jgi:hypothetical protein